MPLMIECKDASEEQVIKAVRRTFYPKHSIAKGDEVTGKVINRGTMPEGSRMTHWVLFDDKTDNETFFYYGKSRRFKFAQAGYEL